jgi:hypothetical protein
MVQFEAFVDDLFLEEGIHHDGGDARLLQFLCLVNPFGKGGGGGDERVFEF